MDVTEQERLTQELRHREAYLAEAQRLSHTGSFGWSVLSGEIVWSEETYRIFEYDQAAKPSLELVLQRVHPEDIALVRQQIDHASQDGKDFDFDYRLLIPSGVIKHLHVVAHAVRDESGKIEFVGAVMDVTERKRVEDRERGRSRILESLTTGASLATILDSVARAIEVEDSTALCTILLLDKERKHLLHGAAPSLPRFFIDAVHGIEIGECVGSCGAAAYTRQRVVVEDLSTHPYWLPYRNLTQKAGLKSCWSEPILAANGEVLGIFGIYHRTLRSPDTNDVQRIKYAADFARLAIEYTQAEGALRESEERFRLISENVADLIAVVDLEGRRVYNSPSYKAILGDPEALHGTDSFNEIHPDDRDKIRAIFEETVRTGVGQRAEYRFLLNDGSIRFIESLGSIIRDREGKPANVLVVSRNVTERKKLEEQLLQSQKMEAIGQLAGGVAHDFNNLLTVISGFGQLTLDTLTEDDPKREYLQEVVGASERAASLTRQLLAFSRQQTLQPTILNLNEVVFDLEKMLRRLIGEDVELVVFLAPKLGRIRADPGQLEQVIVNLVVNARDAMPQGGKLTVETASVELDDVYCREHPAAKPGPHVMLAVSDTGSGMDEKTQAHMFEPFYTTKEKAKGTGLGLATVYGIVKQSEGDIWVYSEPGVGSSIKIYLPRVEEEAVVIRPSGTLPPAFIGTETILVVEDEEPVRRLVCEVLESNGYRVLVAGRGEEALSLSEEHLAPVKLLVTDLVMPGMNGRELAERLATLRPEVKVLYISGYTDNAVVRHSLLNPGTHFLQKPFKPESLARKVREVLDAAQE